jgi:hypothetical protein
MIIKILVSIALISSSAACATIPSAKSDGIDVALGQTAYVDGPKIRPLKVTEDSRCPMNARCIWAGRVRVLVAWVRPGSTKEIELTLGQPVPFADGTLTLTDVKPLRIAGTNFTLKSTDYRFSFQFSGGL